MKISRLLMFIVCLSSLITFAYATDHVVISELGVNPYYGIDFTNDGKEFIELYNPTNSAVDISNWYITFKGMASTSNVIIPSGTSIRSHGYYLIGDTGGNGWPSTWSKPDLFDNFQLTNTNFGIKLLNRLNNVIDAVGWGSLIGYQDYYETQSLDNPIKGYFERKPGYISPNCGNWQDTNNNSNDFLDNSNPSPQNSSFTEQPCNITVGCITNEDCNNLDTSCADGVCNLQISQCQQQFKPSTTVCRAQNGACDLEEKCTGNSATCPADTKSTAQCRGPAGDCDVAEVCDGINNDCPADSFKPSTTVCRASGGVCDLEEKCTGANATCPSDIVRSNAYECRATAGECDIAEKCDGINNNCPSDTKKSAGTSCGQARDCSADKCNSYFAEFYPIDGHDMCDGNGSCVVYSCSLENRYCTDNDGTDGVDTLECGAECDQDVDCGEGYECNLADCSCVLSGEPYCGDGIKNGNEGCDGQDFGSLSCSSFDYDSGSLACNGCLINESGCFNSDTDGDGFIDGVDNCPTIANTEQQDSDSDGIGDACDSCPDDPQNDADKDGICFDSEYCPYDAQNDIDGDEICGDVDYLTGGFYYLKTNVSCLKFSVNNELDLYNFVGLGHVVIKECNKNIPLVEFDFDFGAYTLDLLNAMIDTANNGSGMLISNINLTNKNATKTVYLNRVLSTDTVCVIDSETASLSVSGDCSNGVKLTCDGSAGGYTCEKIENNTMYKINGLRHSAVMEYSYTASQNNNGGGGEGGGGGGGSAIRRNTSMATSSTVTVKPVPKKPAETNKEIPAETSFQEIGSIATPEILSEPEEDVQETIEKEGNMITGALVAATSAIANMFNDNMILRNVVIPFVIIVIVFVIVYFNVRNRKKSKKNRKRKR